MNRTVMIAAISVVSVVLLVILGWVGVQWWVRGNAIAALDEPAPTPQQIVAITNLLDDKEGGVLVKVEEKLLELGPKAVDALVARTRTGEAPIRASAAELVMRIDPARSVDLYIELFDDPDVALRRRLILKLSDLEHERAGEVLVKAAEDTDQNVRGEAANLLAKVGGDASKATLKRLTQDPDPVVSRHATRRLESMSRRR